MRALIILLCACCIHLSSLAADKTPYAVANIPKELLKGANAVKRMETVRFEMKSLTDVVLRRHYVITVLNENGEHHAALAEGYDKLRKINSIEGVLYDAFGNEIKKLKQKDIQDVSGVQDISLIDDNRIKLFNFYHKQFPYTVEFEVEVKLNHSYFFPRWMPVNYTSLSVEKSSFTIVVPQAYKFGYRHFNYSGEPTKTAEKNNSVTTWQVSNLPAISWEVATPVWTNLTTVVYTAPSDFEMEGYKGSMSSWKEMGMFMQTLNKGRDVLPQPIIEKVKSLTADLTTDREKVKVLYDYLQKTTRYISIQLGIGGLQPFEASYVASKGYGDCKALTNYMYSLLKAAGIKSHYALVNADRTLNDKFIIEDFTYDPFDHVILCVPMQKDTMWLECTSQTSSAGYMGSFTGNRKALLIDEDGGKLVNTPTYALNDNLQLRTIKGNVDASGDLKMQVSTLYTGLQQDNLQSILHHRTKDWQKEEVNKRFDIPTYTVDKFAYEEIKGQVPQLKEELELTVDNYVTVSGKRLFIVPNIMNRSATRFENADRKFDFEFDLSFRDVDSIEIQLPEGYEIEAMPKNVELDSKFGKYTSTTRIDGNTLLQYRKFERPNGRFSAKEATELTQFYETIYKADRARVVLVKKED